MVGSMIIFTRETSPSVTIQELLSSYHVDWKHIPMIRTEPIPISNRIERLVPIANWIFFTSAKSVQLFLPYLKKGIKIASIGKQTSKLLIENNFKISFESKKQHGIDFFLEWLEIYQTKQIVLFPHSDLTNPEFTKLLERKGHRVYSWNLYKTIEDRNGVSKIRDVLSKNVSCIWVFASPSAWHIFNQYCNELPPRHMIGAIGKTTANSIIKTGCTVDFMPPIPSIFELIKLILEEKKHEF